MESSDPEQEGGDNVDALLAESSPQEYLNPRSFPSTLSFLLPFLQVSSFTVQRNWSFNTSTVEKNWSFHSSGELFKHSPTVQSLVSFLSCAAWHVWLFTFVSLPACNLLLVNHHSDLFAAAVAKMTDVFIFRPSRDLPPLPPPLQQRGGHAVPHTDLRPLGSLTSTCVA